MKYAFLSTLFFISLHLSGQHSAPVADTAPTKEASHDSHHDHAAGHESEGHHGDHEKYDPAGTAIHHISDANVYTILEGIGVRIPLPVFVYVPGKGWDFFSSSRFHIGHHENGHSAYRGFVMYHGSIYRVVDSSFPTDEEVQIESVEHREEVVDGKKKDKHYVLYQGKEYGLDARSTLDGGILGGGITSFYDFSITKNVVSMILVSLFLFWVFRRAALAYKNNPGKAPSGANGIVETMFLFIQNEVAIPFIGKDKYMRFLPLLMSIFFFILGLNLFGQIPFLGGTNVTGNLTMTMVMSLIIFVIVNINGKKDYWMHIFWMPNVPVAVKPLLTAVEVMGVFIKPLTLMLRLAGNISAGHIAILSFIGLIFIFGDSGQSMAGSAMGTVMSIPLTMFIMAIELIVAFVQAFVFTILAASYIGAALEEHHHAEGHH